MPKGKSDVGKIGNVLILVGGILGLLLGILMILGMGWSFLPGFGWGLGGLITGIILIVISLAVLATNGAVQVHTLKFGNNWLVYLVLGILMYLFGGDLGAVLVIIGAILLLL